MPRARAPRSVGRPDERSTEHRHDDASSSNDTRGEHARERLLAGLPVTERRLRLAGISTVVLEGGDGPPLLLLHGPAGNAAHWARVIPDLR